MKDTVGNNRATKRGYFVSLVFALSIFAVLANRASAQQPGSADVERRADAMIAKLTLEQIDLLSGGGGYPVHAIPEIGLPALKRSDGPLGVKQWGNSPGYAGGIALAASWDIGLAQRLGMAIGQDARARGVSILFAPGVNIYRTPLIGRSFEYFGEDPYLASRMGVGFIKGVQSQGVIATVKHYLANNSEFDRHDENSVVDERTLREIYLPAFEAAVKEGHVGAVMDSYNLINGEHATQNAFLNDEVLRKEWGFRGILMADFHATYDAVAMANNSLDLEEPTELWNRETLRPAIQSGKVSVATIDDKVRRILRTALEFGFFDRPQTDLHISLYPQASRKTALESAEESIVLLKNEGNLLPLDARRLHSIAVIGPDAYPAVPSGSGSGSSTGFQPVGSFIGLSEALQGSGVEVYWNLGAKDVHEIFGRGEFFSGFPQSRFSLDEKGEHPGLHQEEFWSGDLSGQPDRVRDVPILDEWGGSSFAPPINTKLAVRWTGYFVPKSSGPQRFIAAAIGQDSYRLYVADKLVLEDTLHRREGQSPQAVDIDLPAGKPVAVRFEYRPMRGQIAAALGALAVADVLEPEAQKLAAMADVVVLSVGFDQRTEGEGHDRTFRLPPGQDELIQTVLAANPHTIVVLTAGGSVDTSQWIDRVPALLHAWYAGDEGGRVLAEVLLGRLNPSGKLPVSFERRLEDNPAYANYYETPGTHDINYKEGIFLGYRFYDQSSTKPLFPFGFGLSYTTFEFSHLGVSPTAAAADGPITVSFEVQNTGQRAGTEVAQLYVGDPSARVPRPVKELKGFQRVELKAGERKQVSIDLDRRSLAYWDVASKGWKVDPGKFVVYVGNSSANVPLKAEFNVRP